MSDRVSVSPITDDMVEMAARRMAARHLDDEHPQAFDTDNDKAGREYWLDLARVTLEYVLPEVSTAGFPVGDDNEGAALRMARARQWLAHQGGARSGMPVPTWDGLTPTEQEYAELEARHWIQAAVNTGVKIVPAGCTVVALPEPEEIVTDEPGARPHARWDVDSYVVTAIAMPAGPRVNVRGGPLLWADEAEKRGAALIAAAREARRLAGGSQVGDQHG